MRINLSKFKKTRENGDTATLKNELGHEITLSKKNLSPHLIKTLSTLPLHLFEEGDVEDPNASPQNQVLTTPAGGATPVPPPAESPGIVNKFGEFVGNKITHKVLEPAEAVLHGLAVLGHGAHAAASNFGTGMQKGLGIQPAAPQVEAPQSAPAQVQDAGPAAPQGQPMPGQGMPDALSQFQSGNAEFQKGVMGEAAAAGDLGNQQAQTYHDFGDSQKAAFQNYQQQLNDINTERQNLVADLKNQHINPKQYMEDMSTQGKVRSAIGIVLSGIGSGLTGKDNLAVKYLNDQIERNIDAQKANIGLKNNLLAANYHREGSLQNAITMTRANLHDIMANTIAEEASKSAYPNAQARAQQMIGMHNMQAAGQVQQLANQRWAMQQLNSSQGGGGEGDFLKQKQAMQLVNPERAKQMESQYLPGIGTTRIPVKPEDLDAFSHWGALSNTVKNAIDFAQQNGTTMYGTKANQRATDLQNSMQLEVGKLHDLNRINEFEANKYQQMIGNPGALRTGAAIQSFKDLQEQINQKKQAEMQKLGVQPFSQGPSRADAIKEAKRRGLSK